MLIEIKNVFNADQVEKLRTLINSATFVDGKLSAGSHAQRVKNNLELRADAQKSETIDQLIMSTLASNDIFRNAALPARVSQPVVARYSKGMSYGDHIDDPVMGGAAGRFRADVAVTVFLSAIDEYQGGELVINTSFGEQRVKLDQGDVVVYPASSLHRVEAVLEGQRVVAVCWMQSLIRDAAKRELLYELNLARERLLADPTQKIAGKQVDHTYVNLVRMWSEP